MTVTTIAGLGWTATRPAWGHCGDECWNPLPMALPPTSSEVAVDGVLAFAPGHRRAERALEFFTMKVLDAMGEEVAGTFEVFEDFSVFIWRPAQPWTAGATYTVITHVDTAAWATAEYGAMPGACITYDQESTVTVAAEPLPAAAAAPLVVTSEHRVERLEAPEDLVCCDGAYPWPQSSPGSCPVGGGRLVVSPGFCTHLREHGWLEISYDLDREGLPATVASNFAGRLLGPDDAPVFGWKTNLHAPGCLQLESIDLARGEVFVDERCFGDDVADALGPLEVDPTSTLAASCEGQAYVCEGKSSWNPELCTTWPEGQYYPPPEDEPAEESGAPAQSDGGGCSAHERGPGWLGLVVLGGLWLRRRARG
jgi:MYXO-CTERM domain-containing protein